MMYRDMCLCDRMLVHGQEMSDVVDENRVT